MAWEVTDGMTTNVKTALRRKTDEDRLGRLQVAQPDKLVARFVRLLAHRLKSTTGLPVGLPVPGLHGLSDVDAYGRSADRRLARGWRAWRFPARRRPGFRRRDDSDP